EVMEILVVESHEGELDALEFSLLDGFLRAAETHLAHLLPIGVRGRASANAGDLQDLGAKAAVLRGGARRKDAEAARGAERQGTGAGRTLQHASAAGLPSHQKLVDILSHGFLPEVLCPFMGLPSPLIG